MEKQRRPPEKVYFFPAGQDRLLPVKTDGQPIGDRYGKGKSRRIQRKGKVVF